jgi:uncharacterized protein (TIGR02246 family)
VTDAIDTADRNRLDGIVASLEAAWNAGNGIAFGRLFSSDADFVNIRAEHFHGRDAIASGHAAIFRTIYAHSTAHFTVESSRLLRPDVAVLHVKSVLDVPSGPMAGRHSATFSVVLTRELSGWEIASFHNTLSPPAAPHA